MTTVRPEHKLVNTLGSAEWLSKNETAIKAAFPSDWTPLSLEVMSRVGFKLKVLGCDWRSELELQKIFEFLEKCRLIMFRGDELKANPENVYSTP